MITEHWTHVNGTTAHDDYEVGLPGSDGAKFDVVVRLAHTKIPYGNTDPEGYSMNVYHIDESGDQHTLATFAVPADVAERLLSKLYAEPKETIG